MYKKTIMIDLDGVLNNYTEYKENFIPEIKYGATNFLEELKDKYNLVLFTTREKSLVKKWLYDNNISIYFSEITNIKKPAYLYIDDRAINFDGNYNKTLEDIRNFKVYWKT